MDDRTQPKTNAQQYGIVLEKVNSSVYVRRTGFVFDLRTVPDVSYLARTAPIP
jgi:hypothetical protein